MEIHLTEPEDTIITLEEGSPGLSAYELALSKGFEGTLEEWLTSLVGERGMSAYEVAVDDGFGGNVTEWLESLVGPQGLSAYQVAVDEGFSGSVSDWLLSLVGDTGKSAYEVAVDNGFIGTEPEWLESLAAPPNTLTAGTVTQIPAGGQPTVSITGTAPNQTLNLGLVDGSPTAYELRGEGFPGTGTNATATNAAAVGTYYTDTLGTNGAWRWLKTSAGTGTARWVVALGDTGWRRVLAVNAAGDTTVGVLPTGISKGNPAQEMYIDIRRTADRVSVRMFNVLRDNSVAVITLATPAPPLGFSAQTQRVSIAIVGSSGGVAATATVVFDAPPQGIGFKWGLRNATGGSWATSNQPTIIFAGSEQFPENMWPATLPGTPA